MPWRRPLAIALAPYAAWLVLAYEYHFLDGVNLAFHEAGHLFLRFGGETLHFLGGTLGQLVFPAALAARFARRGEPFEAAVCTLWLGESLMNVGVYLGDAQAQALPLVGGHIHDWNWLLGRAGLLAQAESLGRLLHVLASALVLGAWGWCARAAFAAPDAGREIAPRQPLFRRQT
jgi:hypothetical protein